MTEPEQPRSHPDPLTLSVNESIGWSRSGHLESVHAEGAVAAELERRHPGSVAWYGGNKEGFDIAVDAHAGNTQNRRTLVDAKTAFIEQVRLSGDPEPCLGFMGSLRRRRSGQQEAREGIAYALVLIHLPPGQSGFYDFTGLHMTRIDSLAAYTIFWFEENDVNALFKPAMRLDGATGSGANLWVPFAHVKDRHFFAGVKVDSVGKPIEDPFARLRRDPGTPS